MKFGKPKKSSQGKKTQQWNAAREQLKALFKSRGITFCEKCGKDWTDADLGFAHSKTRQFIVGNEIFEVALLCNYPCHHELEMLRPGYLMTEAIKEIIKNRGWDAQDLLEIKE